MITLALALSLCFLPCATENPSVPDDAADPDLKVSIEQGQILALWEKHPQEFETILDPIQANELARWCMDRGYHEAYEMLLEFGVSTDWRDLESVSSWDGGKTLSTSEYSLSQLVTRNPINFKRMFETTLRYTREAHQTDEFGNGLWHNYILSLTDYENKLRYCRMDPIVLYCTGADFCKKSNAGFYPADALLEGLVFGSSGFRPELSIFEFFLFLNKMFGESDGTLYASELQKYANGHGGEEDAKRALHQWIDYLNEDGLRFRNIYFGRVVVYSISVMGDVVGAFDSAVEEEASMSFQGRYRYGPLESSKEVRELPELIKVWTGPHAVGRGGFNYLIAAAMSLNYQAMEFLLDMGVDPDLTMSEDLWELTSWKDAKFSSPSFSLKRTQPLLHAFCLNPVFRLGHIPLLLKHSKSPDKRDWLNRNALHMFVFYRVDDSQVSLLDLLVKHGVDINAQSVSGATPCHNAVIRNANLIPHLVELGADLQLKDWRGENVIERLRQSVREKWTFWEESQETLEKLGYDIED